MNDGLVVTIATVLLIALSAFFVIIEFALLGARRHRLEATAATSRSARAALKGDLPTRPSSEKFFKCKTSPAVKTPLKSAVIT